MLYSRGIKHVEFEDQEEEGTKYLREALASPPFLAAGVDLRFLASKAKRERQL